jgi:hypothetical protein
VITVEGERPRPSDAVGDNGVAGAGVLEEPRRKGPLHTP